MTALLGGIAVLALGVVVIHFREAFAQMQRDIARDEARYGSLLNAERANREYQSELTPDARKAQTLGVVVFGLVLIAAGVVAVVYGVGTL